MKTSNYLQTLNELGIPRDPSLPKADITNAPELFGDPFDFSGDPFEFGDFDDGDPDLYGDVDLEGDPDLYGDVGTADIEDTVLGRFNILSGDIEEGAPLKAGLSRVARSIVRPSTKAGRIARNAALAAAGAGAAYGLSKIVLNRIKAAKARKAAMRAALQQQLVKQTVYQQQIAKTDSPKINRKSKILFIQVSGAKLNASPIVPSESFIADMLKFNLDRQASDTPFLQESAIGTLSGSTWTAQATGVTNPRFFTACFLQIGVNALAGVPASVVNITATIPTVSGPLTISSQPISLTLSKGFDVKLLLFPWRLVANRALPVLGQYDTSNPIVFQVTGLPSSSAVTLVVPGSLHPWTISMRNSLI